MKGLLEESNYSSYWDERNQINAKPFYVLQNNRSKYTLIFLCNHINCYSSLWHPLPIPTENRASLKKEGQFAVSIITSLAGFRRWRQQENENLKNIIALLINIHFILEEWKAKLGLKKWICKMLVFLKWHAKSNW